MAFYKFPIDDDLNMEQVDQNDNSQEHSLFRTRYVIHQKIFDVVIDHGSPENFVSRDVQHLKIPIETIPDPYTIRWANSASEIMVTKFCKIPFAIGKYKDEMMFDIVKMDACHIILEKPWVDDLKATYNDTENTYMFRFNGVKKIVVPLIDNNDTKVSTLTEDDSIVTGQQDLMEEPKNKLVIDAIVATTMIQDDISNKIPEKMKPLDEESLALIPDELQLIFSLVQDIPLPNFPGYNIEEENMVQNMEVIQGLEKHNIEFDSAEYDDLGNKHYRVKKFEVGHLVMVDLRNIYPIETYNKLKRKMISLCKVIGKISSNAYVVSLPMHLSVSPVFTVDDMFQLQQDVPFFLGGNLRTSFLQEGENDAVRVGIG